MNQLRYEAYSHEHKRVRIKMHCLLLKSQGLQHGKIAKIVGICQDTLLTYFEQYIAGGIEGLKILNFHKPESDLEEYRTIIEEDLDQNPTATLKETADRIEKVTIQNPLFLPKKLYFLPFNLLLCKLPHLLFTIASYQVYLARVILVRVFLPQLLYSSKLRQK